MLKSEVDLHPIQKARERQKKNYQEKKKKILWEKREKNDTPDIDYTNIQFDN